MLLGSLVLVMLLAAVFLTVLFGVGLMGVGGKKNSRYGNKFMVARVVLQGAALAVIMVMYLLANSK